MDVESYLDQSFADYAASLQNDVNGKKFSYIILDRNLDRTDKRGICTIESVRYDKSDDSNYYTIKDVDTGRTYSFSQFYLELNEIE